MKNKEDITHEDWNSFVKICKHYQYEMKGKSLVIPVVLESISGDPSEVFCRVEIGRAYFAYKKHPLDSPADIVVKSVERYTEK